MPCEDGRLSPTRSITHYRGARPYIPGLNGCSGFLVSNLAIIGSEAEADSDLKRLYLRASSSSGPCTRLSVRQSPGGEEASESLSITSFCATIYLISLGKC